MKALFPGFAVALLVQAVSADEVFLKSGGQLSGRIVSRTATTIEVDVGAGRIGVPVSSVVRIEEGRSAAPGVRGSRRPPRPRRRGRLGRAGRVGLGRGSRHAGARGVPARARARRPATRARTRRSATCRSTAAGSARTRATGRRATCSSRESGSRPPSTRRSCASAPPTAEQDRQRKQAESRAARSGGQGAGGGGTGPAGRGGGERGERRPSAVVRLGRGTRRPGRRDRSSRGRSPRGRSRCRGERRERASSSWPRWRPSLPARRLRADGGRDRGPARGGARRPRGAGGGAHAAHDGPRQRRPRPRGDRPARDRAPRPHPHRVRVPGDDGHLRLGRLRGLARVSARRQPRARAAARPRPPPSPPSRPTSRARSSTGRPRATWWSASGRDAARRRRARAEGHAQVRRRASHLGRRQDRPRGADGVDAHSCAATRWRSRRSTATTASPAASASRGRSRSACGAGRSGCASSWTAWRRTRRSTIPGSPSLAEGVKPVSIASWPIRQA